MIKNRHKDAWGEPAVEAMEIAPKGQAAMQRRQS
jgi:hypothetical protein